MDSGSLSSLSAFSQMFCTVAWGTVDSSVSSATTDSLWRCLSSTWTCGLTSTWPCVLPSSLLSVWVDITILWMCAMRCLASCGATTADRLGKITWEARRYSPLRYTAWYTAWNRLLVNPSHLLWVQFALSLELVVNPVGPFHGQEQLCACRRCWLVCPQTTHQNQGPVFTQLLKLKIKVSSLVASTNPLLNTSLCTPNMSQFCCCRCQF